MASEKTKKAIAEILAKADIQIDGTRPWDPQIHHERVYDRVVKAGSIGLGEAYMNGDWDAEQIDELVTKVFLARLPEYVRSNPRLILHLLGARIFNKSSKSRAFEIAHKHYDIGNDLYTRMLDKRLVYTCGYWKNAKTLDEAQEAKLDLTCRKIGLTKGMTVLDIGGGWGSFAQFAAEKYGAHVTNITVSKEQVALANDRCKGLSVENYVLDYRDVPKKFPKKFDRLVSLGMFEHVGPKNYRIYMEIARAALKDEGLFLLHTIGSNTSESAIDPWIDKYIFPNATLPSIKQIGASLEGLFVMEDWHNFGPDYDKTLMAWHANFVKHWPEISDKYGERFYRMWRLYLLSSAANFRARNAGLWQIVLSPRGVPGGYQSIR